MRYLSLLPLLAGVATVWAEGGSSSKSEGPDPTDILDDQLARLAILVLGSMCAVVLFFRYGLRFTSHIRQMASLTNDTQRYFVTPSMSWARLKKHVLYAPLFRTRHNREFKLSSAVNMGTLPTRFQMFLVVGVVAMNVTLCCVTVPYPQQEKVVAGIIRNRTGTMATMNLVPLILMAGRNNPLIRMLGVSFDTWNLLHRWLGRIVVLEAIAHTLAWMIPKVQAGGWSVVAKSLEGSELIMTGLVAVLAFFTLALHSFSALRHAFYETFLHLHIALVVVAFAFLWMHLAEYPQQKYLIATIVLWAAERFSRVAIVLYRNLGRGNTTAVVEALPGEAMRVTLKMARPWDFKPGQHLYLYVPSVGIWTSHPFTVAWSDTEEMVTDEKGIVMSRQDVLSMHKTTLSLIIRQRTGFTNKLYQKAANSMGGRISLKAFAEGPYGDCASLDSYGTVLLFASGVGITHQVSYIRHLLAGYANGTVAARRVTLVWSTPAPEHLEWIRPWMTAILGMDKRRDILRIMLFITRPRNTKEIHSPSATVQMFPGRPNIDTLVEMETQNQIGAMGVVSCGAGSMGDDIRRACRKRQTKANIDYIEEAFTW